jgi:hypothetical protein
MNFKIKAMLMKISPEFRPSVGSSRIAMLRRAFTLLELIVILAVCGLLALMLLPALAQVRPDSQAFQCLNNLRQMSRSWKMYSEDFNGRIVSSYPNFGGFKGTWCDGSADSGGTISYNYGGADPAGIQSGLLWPYTRALGLYHCPTDHRIADAVAVPAQFKGKPILRSISMNAYLDGASLGANPDWDVTNPSGARDPKYPVYVQETEIRQPKQTFVLIDEDQASINDGMFLLDITGRKLYDLPSRAHRFGYGICFADGHAEISQLKADASKTWVRGEIGGFADWKALTNVATHPL